MFQEDGQVDVAQVDRTVVTKDSALFRNYNVDWILPKNYECVKLISNGRYSSVMLAKDTQSIDEDTQQPRWVSIKRLSYHTFARSKYAERALREITYLDEVYYSNHIADYSRVLPHWVIPGQETEPDLKTVYIVTEYCHHDLKSIFQSLRSQNQRFNWQLIARIMHQVVCGLKYLHSAGLVLGNLKPENICVDTASTFYTKIIDLSFCKRSNQYVQSQDYDDNDDDTLIEIETYRAPEIIMGYASHTYASSMDMWNLGIVLGEMILCQHWLASFTPLMLIQSIARLIGKFPDLNILDKNVQTMLCSDENVKNLLTTDSPGSLKEDLLNGKPGTSQSPLEGYNPYKDQFKYTNINGEILDDSKSDELFHLYVDMIEKLLVWMPDNRPSADAILDHQFFRWFDGQIVDRQEERTFGEDQEEIYKNFDVKYASDIESNRGVEYYKSKIVEIIDNPPQFE